MFGNVNISDGLEHILLEAKKFIFYQIKEQNILETPLLFASFKNKIKNLIIIEKKVAESKSMLDQFEKKWDFCAITFFNFYVPDLDLD